MAFLIGGLVGSIIGGFLLNVLFAWLLSKVSNGDYRIRVGSALILTLFFYAYGTWGDGMPIEVIILNCIGYAVGAAINFWRLGLTEKKKYDVETFE